MEPGHQPGVFLDAFAGSGSVARLARTLGFEVHANDWEPYAQIMNRAFLTLTPQAVTGAFAPLGGLDVVRANLNGLTARLDHAIPERRWINIATSANSMIPVQYISDVKRLTI